MAGNAENRLYDATSKGDLTSFHDVLQQHPHLLDRASFAYSRNVLHIAALWGQVGIVEEVLERNPLLAEDLDSKNSSPLHIAAGKGHFQIVTMLSAKAPDMCFSLDCQGMNPIHIAAKNGHVEILEHLLELNPAPAMERMSRGETVFHLCVKHGQLGSVRVLVEKLGELVHAKDDDGNTLLHLAVRCNQLEMVGYLVRSTNVFKETMNSAGYTPGEILDEMPSNHTTSEMKKVIKKGSKLFRHILEPKSRDNIMLVLALVATVAFQSIVAPPGGVWQEDSSTHKAGEAVMASNRPNVYIYFIAFNTVAFVASLFAMYMMIPASASVLPITSPFIFSGFGIALGLLGMSYGASLMVILPNPVKQTIDPAMYAFVGIISCLLLIFGLIIFLMKRRKRH